MACRTHAGTLESLALQMNDVLEAKRGIWDNNKLTFEKTDISWTRMIVITLKDQETHRR
jgi:hypothetical protein